MHPIWTLERPPKLDLKAALHTESVALHIKTFNTCFSLLMAASICKQVYIFGIIVKIYFSQKWLRNFDKFQTSKRAKNTQKVPSLPPFATREAVLGDSILGGANGLQIKILKFSQKLDSPKFPMSYSAPDLDFGKPSKAILEKVLHIGSNGATHKRKICQFFLFDHNFAQFSVTFTFSSLLVN